MAKKGTLSGGNKEDLLEIFLNKKGGQLINDLESKGAAKIKGDVDLEVNITPELLINTKSVQAQINGSKKVIQKAFEKFRESIEKDGEKEFAGINLKSVINAIDELETLEELINKHAKKKTEKITIDLGYSKEEFEELKQQFISEYQIRSKSKRRTKNDIEASLKSGVFYSAQEEIKKNIKNEDRETKRKNNGIIKDLLEATKQTEDLAKTVDQTSDAIDKTIDKTKEMSESLKDATNNAKEMKEAVEEATQQTSNTKNKKGGLGKSLQDIADENASDNDAPIKKQLENQGNQIEETEAIIRGFKKQYYNLFTQAPSTKLRDHFGEIKEEAEKLAKVVDALGGDSGKMRKWSEDFEKDLQKIIQTRRNMEAIQKSKGMLGKASKSGSSPNQLFGIEEDLRGAITDKSKLDEVALKYRKESTSIDELVKKYERLIDVKSKINDITKQYPSENVEWYGGNTSMKELEDLGIKDILSESDIEQVQYYIDEITKAIEIHGKFHSAMYEKEDFDKLPFKKQLDFFNKIADHPRAGKSNYEQLQNDFLDFVFVLEDGTEQVARRVMDLGDTFKLYEKIRNKIVSIKTSVGGSFEKKNIEDRESELHGNVEARFQDLGWELDRYFEPIVKKMHQELVDAFTLDDDILSTWSKTIDRLSDESGRWLGEVWGYLPDETIEANRNKLIGQLQNAYYEKLNNTEAPQELIEAYNDLYEAFIKKDTFPTIQEAIEQLNQKAKDLGVTFDETTKKWIAFGEPKFDANKELDLFQDSINLGEDTPEQLDEKFSNLMNDIMAQTKTGQQAIEEFKTEAQKLGLTFDETAQKWVNIESPAETQNSFEQTDKEIKKVISSTDTLIDKLEYLKLIKKESDFYSTAEDKRIDMEEKAWDVGGNRPKSEADSLSKIQKYEDHIEHMEKANKALNEFEENYEKVIVTMKNGEKIEITDLIDLDDISLAKNKIKDIEFVLSEELQEMMGAKDKAKQNSYIQDVYNLLDKLDDYDQKNVNHQLYPPVLWAQNNEQDITNEIEKIKQYVDTLKELKSNDLFSTLKQYKQDEVYRNIEFFENLIKTEESIIETGRQMQKVAEEEKTEVQEFPQIAEETSKTIKRSQEEIRAEIEDTNKVIKIQEQWLKSLWVLDKDYTTNGKSEANAQLRDATKALINFRRYPEDYAGQTYTEEKLGINWYKSYQEAQRQGSASSVLSRYKTDIYEDSYIEYLKSLQEEYSIHEKTLEEHRNKLIALQQELAEATKPIVPKETISYGDVFNTNTASLDESSQWLEKYTVETKQQTQAVEEHTEAIKDETTAIEQNTQKQKENKKARLYTDGSGQYSFVAQGKRKKGSNKSSAKANELIDEQVPGQYTMVDWVNELAVIEQQANRTNTSLQKTFDLLQYIRQAIISSRAFQADIQMTPKDQNERLLSGAKPIIDVDYREITESVEQVNEVLTEEVIKINELGNASEKIVEQKNQIVEANAELVTSTQPSIDEIQKEKEALNDMGGAANNAEKRLEELEEEANRYLRTQSGSANDDVYSYVEALNDFVNRRVSIGVDDEGNQTEQEQILINYDKLTRALIANDKQILNLQHQINSATAEEKPFIQANLDLFEKEGERLEKIFQEIQDKSIYEADAGQINVVNERRELAKTITENTYKAKEAKRITEEQNGEYIKQKQLVKEIADMLRKTNALEYTYNKSLAPGVSKPVTDISDLEQLEIAKQNALAGINKLSGRDDVTEQEKQDVIDLIDTYKQLIKVKKDTNNVTKREMGGQELKQAIRQEITALEAAIAKSKQYGDITKEITAELELYKDSLKDFPIGGAADVYDAQNVRKYNEAILRSIQIEQNRQKIEERAKRTQTVFDLDAVKKLNDLVKYEADLQKLGLYSEDANKRVLELIDTLGKATPDTGFKEFDRMFTIFKQDMSSEIDSIKTMNTETNKFVQLIASLPKLEQAAFKGNADASNNFIHALVQIRDLWKNIQEYNKTGLISNEDVQRYEQSYINAFSSIRNYLQKDVRTDGQGAEYLGLFEQTKTSIEQLKTELNLTDLVNADDEAFFKLGQTIKAVFDNILKLGTTYNQSPIVKTEDVNKLIGDTSVYLQKNSSIPKGYQDQLKGLIDQLLQLKSQFGEDLIPADQFGAVKKQIIEIESEMKRLGYTGRSMSDKISRSLKNSLISVSRMYLSWYRWISYIRQGITEVTNMDAALTKMSYTMNVTDTQLQNMSNQMVQMAKDLSSSVSNIQQIYQIYANLQTSQEELEKIARPTAILANLSSVDAATAADQIQGVLNQFSLTADAAEHVVDVYDKISASIKVDYSKGIAGMADAVKNVGNYAAQAGVSFEQLSAIVAKVMEKTRQDGAAVGNALRTIMVRLSKANKLADPDEIDNTTLSNASKALSEVGIQVYTLEGEYREFDVIMSELAAKWNTLNDAQKANISFNIAATRQATVLNAILQQYDESMQLATDATIANGNAMANQQKYMDSIAGRTQALKTELSALWLDLLSSDSIKELIDGIKEFVISLQDSATGLKPVVDLLSQILSFATKILSKIPAGGIIATFLGLKYGSKISSFLKITTEEVSETAEKMDNLKDAAEGASEAIKESAKETKTLSTSIKANWIGILITAFTIFVSIAEKLTVTTKEFHEELDQAYDDAKEKLDDITQEVENLNYQLTEQQKIVDELSGKRLNYIEQEQLKNAQRMTEELELQLKLDKDIQKYRTGLTAAAASDKWEHTYFNDKASLMNEYVEILKDSPHLQKQSESEIESFVRDHFDQAEKLVQELDEDIPEISKAMSGFKDWSEIDSGKAKEEIKDLYQQIKEYEEYVTQEDADKYVVAYYDSVLKPLYDEAIKYFYPTDWDTTAFNNIFNNADENLQKKLQKELTKLEEEIYEWANDPKHSNVAYHSNVITSLIRSRIKSGDYKELEKVLNDTVFTQSTYDKSNNDEIFAREFYARFNQGIKNEVAKNPISLATWFGNSSDLEKSWSEVLSSLESELNTLGGYFETLTDPTKTLSRADIAATIDSSEGIFKQLGMSDFEKYIDGAEEYLKEHADDLRSAEEVALTSFMQDVYGAFMNAAGNGEGVENFDVITQKMRDMIQVASGGAPELQKLKTSYEELTSLLDRMRKGETLEGEEAKDLVARYDSLAGAIVEVNGKYQFQEEELVNLINQYIEMQNTAVSAEAVLTTAVINDAKTKIIAFGIEASAIDTVAAAYRRLGKSYNNLDTVGGKVQLAEQYAKEYGLSMQEAWAVVQDIASSDSQIEKLVSSEDKLKELLEELNKLGTDKHDYGTDTKSSNSEIDWIANSLNNIQHNLDRVQAKYDRLLTTFGSKKALKTANDGLEAINEQLNLQAEGYDRAAKAYQAEFDKLNLTDKQKQLVKNAATTGVLGWTIEEYGEAEYKKLNDALKHWQSVQDAEEKAEQARHQAILNDIQAYQNTVDYYGAQIAKYEAAITPETSVKKQQKYVTKLIDLYNQQYETQKDIARLKGDELELAKLINEQEQKENELIAQRSQISIDAITTRYDRIVSEYENRQRILEHGVAMTEGKGQLVSKNYYKALIDNDRREMKKLYEEREKLVSELNKINTTSTEGLDQWWDTKNKIDDVTSSMYELEEATLEYAKAIRQVDWDLFDRVQNTIHGVADEAEYLIGLFANDDPFKYVKEIWDYNGSQQKVYYGGFSDEGLVMLGLYEAQLKTNAELAEKAAIELEDLNKQIAESTEYDLDLIDRRNTVIEQQREYTNSVEATKNAIISLVKEGYDKQLESLSELSSRYMDALRSEKDLEISPLWCIPQCIPFNCGNTLKTINYNIRMKYA